MKSTPVFAVYTVRRTIAHSAIRTSRPAVEAFRLAIGFEVLTHVLSWIGAHG